MKKLLVILLALVAIGSVAFAQAKLAVGIDGKVMLIDQTLMGATSYYNNTYVNGFSFSGSDADGIKGLSVSFTGGAEWTKATAPTVANYKGYWNFFDKKVKVLVGDFNLTDYRGYSLYAGLNNGGLGGGTKQQFTVQAFPVDGLSFAVQLPYSTTSTAVVTLAKSAAFGASYKVPDVGQARAFVNLNALVPFVGASFDYTGTENLEVLVWGSYAKSSNTIVADLSTTYTQDKLWFALEGKVTFDTALTYVAYAECDYTLNDNATVWLCFASDSTAPYDISTTLDYNFGNGVKVQPTVGYGADGLYWNVPVKFAVNF